MLTIDTFKAALATNNKYRRADVTDVEDLHTLADVNQALFTRIADPACIVPVGHTLGNPMSQKEYNEKFFDRFPFMKEVLSKVNTSNLVDRECPVPVRVVVAGGAAVSPLISHEHDGDIDLFVVYDPMVDCTPQRLEASLWSAVERVVATLPRTMLGDIEGRAPAYREIVMHPGLVTIEYVAEVKATVETSTACDGEQILCNSDPLHTEARVPIHKIQIILRAYPSASAILHAFDVPSCAIAFDGKTTHLTTLSAWSLRNMMNAVIPEYSSTTYESRLVKYFERGFGLLLPGLSSVGSMSLPRLQIVALYLHLWGGMVGKISCTEDQPLSDYGPSWTSALPIENYCHEEGVWRFAVAVSDIPSKVSTLHGYPYINIKTGDFSFFRRSGAPSRDDLLSNSQLDLLFKYMHSAAVLSSGHPNERALRKYYRMRDADIAAFSKYMRNAYLQVYKNPSYAHINTEEYLQPTKDELIKAFQARPNKIDWWITVDPGRQYTASVNPRVEDPATWYGQHYDPPAPCVDGFIVATN